MMKRLAQRPARFVQGTDRDILEYLEQHGTHDKDSAVTAARDGVRARSGRRERGGHRVTLDLHGLTSEEASRRLRCAVGSCRERGVKELLVIHGWGRNSPPGRGPVLKGLVEDVLGNELRLQVRDFRKGRPREGGDGATVVYLV